MNINQTAIVKLLRINWLSNVGKDGSIPNTIRVKNINAFQLNLESEEWENVHRGILEFSLYYRGFICFI